VKKYFDSLRNDGISDLEQYFKNYPDKRALVLQLAKMVKIVDLNQAHFALYQVRKEDYSEVVEEIYNTYTDQLIDEYINQFIALANGELNYVTEMPPHKTIDGQLKYVISYLQVDPNFKHDLSSVYVLYIDVTEQKLAEHTLKENEYKLKVLNADKDRFISILAHDLRSPFNSLLGFLDLLNSNIRNYDIEKSASMVKMIHNSAHNVSNLLKDILIWATSHSGKLPFEPQLLNFPEIIEHVISSVQPVADSKGIKIEYLGDKDILVFADQNMIKTVFRNLISNAVKFTFENGHINILLKTDQGKITCTVSDNGMGISPDSIGKLFDISQTFTTRGTTNEKGTGLGLLICKEFIENHGGRIWVESKLGEGSDFKFELPETVA